MKKLFPLLLFISSIFFMSCEEEIVLSRKDFKPKIVLNSMFTNDSIWIVSLTRSTSIFDGVPQDNNYVEDAVVVILNDKGEQVCKLWYAGKGLYKSSGCTVKTEHYTLYAYSKQYGNVSATSYVPQQISKEAIEVKTEVGEKGGKISMTIKDPQKKHYVWSIYTIDTTKYEVPTRSGYLRLDFNELVKDIDRSAKSVSKLDVDQLVTNVEYISIDNTYKSSIATDELDKISYNYSQSLKTGKISYIKLMTFSPELYNYVVSMEEYFKYSNHQSSAIEPQRLYSNVKNGLGIFAGYSVQYIPLVK